jgi:Fic-DOC domain mobile mystery protein B
MSHSEVPGATPLDPDEAGALLPGHLRTWEEVNEWEQQNILEAMTWALGRKPKSLSEVTIRELHRRMFERTWSWAGRYRSSDKNFGVPWFSISSEVLNLVRDGQYWIENGTYSMDEAALRLHHRLVQIRPFANGNGRHARLWCDLFLREQGRPMFVWRSKELDHPGAARHAYISALQAADRGDYSLLTELLIGSGR